MQNNDKAPDLTRRRFLTGSLLVATSALIGCGTLKPAEMASAGSTPATPAPSPTPVQKTNDSSDMTKLPWKYETLDLEKVRKRGYENYFTGGCCYAASSALIQTLKEVVGSPWDKIPLEMFNWGAGGGLSWGTLCGALNGSLYVLQLAAGKDMNPLGNELIGWYTEFPFPSKLSDAYAKFPNQITTVAKSPLCHESVSIWANAAKAKINSDEKKDRCAKLSGDTAAKAAELLNQWKAGKFAAVFKASPEYNNCLTCHNGKTSALDNEQGLMNCLTCHEDKALKHP